MFEVVLLFVALLLPLAAGWVFLCLGLRKSGPRRVAGAIAIQISGVAFVWTLLTSNPLAAIVTAVLPPFMIFPVDRYLQFDRFFGQMFFPAVAVGLLVAGAFLWSPRLRLWCLAPGLIACLVAGLVVGERVSQREMCRTAEAAGIADFRRHTLFWSLRNTPYEFQFEIHAIAKLGAKRLGWSYYEMGWYEIPANAWGDVGAPVFDCSGFADRQS